MKNLPDLWNRFSPLSRSPFRELQDMQRYYDRWFGNDMDVSKMTLNAPAFTPSCDIDETDTHYLLKFDLPGVKREDIKVEFQENLLTVSGERKEEREEKKANRTRSESFFGSFERSFTLPRTIKAEQIEASYTDGVLKLSVPKTEAAKTQHIKIGDGKPKSVPIQDRKPAA